MKAILISVRPEWVEKILNGEKTIEIRKTMPKCELPIKCYIYCTKPRRWFIDSPFTMFSYEELWIQDGKIYNGKDDSLWKPDFNHYYRLNGKVVGEFTLNKVRDYVIRKQDNKFYWGFESKEDIMNLLNKSCLNGDQIFNYIGDSNHCYAWHIDDLKIYDKPKELSEFSTILHRMKGKQTRYTSHLLQIPPQSYMFVEDLGEV